MMGSDKEGFRIGNCAYCGKLRTLCRSHAIPNAAFKNIFRSSGGLGIAIPSGDGNIHKTSESGSAYLLCQEDEEYFNRTFDGPIINALKKLDNEIQIFGKSARIEFSSDQAAHAILSIAWRICASPSSMYSMVNLNRSHRVELNRIFRLKTPDILSNCSIRLGWLFDGSRNGDNTFNRKELNQFIMSPQAYSLRVEPHGKLNRFAIDWTMFGFLIHVVISRIPYPHSKRFGGLKRGSKWITASQTDLFEYKPILDALTAGYKKKVEGKLTPNLTRHK